LSPSQLTNGLRARWKQLRASFVAPALVAVVALFVYSRALDWGLPGGDETWAADAIKPSAPLAVAFHNFGHGWNSGWFWFKYPPFHAFLLCALYAPYLAWLWATGGLAGFQSDYPFGLADPVASLSMLAWIGRAASAAMGAGCALLVYACVARSFGRRAAVCAALVTTFAYPMVFYSQTTNVEVPYLFWLLASLVGAVRIIEDDRRLRWWVLLGAGAALSVSTKELAAGAFLAVPVVIVVRSLIMRVPVWTWIRGGLVAGLSFAIAIALANNVLFNPLGFVQRTKFLTQTLPSEIALRYAPYYFPIQLGGNRGAGVELAQLSLALSRLSASLGWPTLALSIAGFLIAARRRPAWTLLLVAAGAGYYLVSVRAMLSLSLRYLLPLTVLCCAASGIAIAELVRARTGPAARWRPLGILVAALAAVWIFAYGWDVNRMMAGDARYDAERWLALQAARRPRVEIYQNRAYLPRFPEGIDVIEVPYEQRDATAFAERHPDLVVLSSSGLSGITVRYKQDWQSDSDGDSDADSGYSPAQRSAGGAVMNYTRDANAEFLRRLTAGELGYTEAARFSVTPWIDRPLIQSLNPAIVIYAAASAQPAAILPRPGTAD